MNQPLTYVLMVSKRVGGGEILEVDKTPTSIGEEYLNIHR